MASIARRHDLCIEERSSRFARDGVKGVDVDLDSGRVTVAGESFEDDAIRRAIDEAGYTLVS